MCGESPELWRKRRQNQDRRPKWERRGPVKGTCDFRGYEICSYSLRDPLRPSIYLKCRRHLEIGQGRCVHEIAHNGALAPHIVLAGLTTHRPWPPFSVSPIGWPYSPIVFSWKLPSVRYDERPLACEHNCLIEPCERPLKTGKRTGRYGAMTGLRLFRAKILHGRSKAAYWRRRWNQGIAEERVGPASPAPVRDMAAPLTKALYFPQRRRQPYEGRFTQN